MKPETIDRKITPDTLRDMTKKKTIVIQLPTKRVGYEDDHGTIQTTDKNHVRVQPFCFDRSNVYLSSSMTYTSDPVSVFTNNYMSICKNSLV